LIPSFVKKIDTFKSPHHTLDTALPDLKSLGYDGIEIPLKAILHFGKDKFKGLLAESGLEVVVMVFTDGPVAPGHPWNVFGGPYPG
jgi:sugar phosphate isomerase/epimerase